MYYLIHIRDIMLSRWSMIMQYNPQKSSLVMGYNISNMYQLTFSQCYRNLFDQISLVKTKKVKAKH